MAPESEEQRTGSRPRRRRDLGSRLQAQRRAQRVAWDEGDENEGQPAVPGERAQPGGGGWIEGVKKSPKLDMPRSMKPV